MTREWAVPRAMIDLQIDTWNTLDIFCLRQPKKGSKKNNKHNGISADPRRHFPSTEGCAALRGPLEWSIEGFYRKQSGLWGFSRSGEAPNDRYVKSADGDQFGPPQPHYDKEKQCDNSF